MKSETSIPLGSARLSRVGRANVVTDKENATSAIWDFKKENIILLVDSERLSVSRRDEGFAMVRSSYMSILSLFSQVLPAHCYSVER